MLQRSPRSNNSSLSSSAVTAVLTPTHRQLNASMTTRVMVTPYVSSSNRISASVHTFPQQQQQQPVIHVGLPCPPSVLASAPPYPGSGRYVESAADQDDGNYYGDASYSQSYSQSTSPLGNMYQPTQYYVTGYPLGFALPPGYVGSDLPASNVAMVQLSSPEESSYDDTSSQAPVRLGAAAATVTATVTVNATATAEADLTAAVVIRHWLTSIFVSELIMLILHVLILDYFATAGSVSALTGVCILSCRCLAPLPLKVYTWALALWSVSIVFEVVGIIRLALSLASISAALSNGAVFGGAIVVGVWIALYVVLVYMRVAMIALCQRARVELQEERARAAAGVEAGGEPGSASDTANVVQPVGVTPSAPPEPL